VEEAPGISIGTDGFGCFPQGQIHFGGDVLRQTARDLQCQHRETVPTCIAPFGQAAEQMKHHQAGDEEWAKAGQQEGKSTADAITRERDDGSQPAEAVGGRGYARRGEIAVNVRVEDSGGPFPDYAAPGTRLIIGRRKRAIPYRVRSLILPLPAPRRGSAESRCKRRAVLGS
jgi:hypothetical protein